MNLASLDLNLLRILNALLVEGSTTRAAERVGLSQPAVSAALGRLRKALGDPLFIRCGQGLEPTDYARALARPLRETLDGLQTLLEGADAFDPASSTRIFRISGSDFFAELLMPQLAESLSRTAPSVRVQLVDFVQDLEFDALHGGRIEMALLPYVDAADGLSHCHVFDSPYALIARAGHPTLSNVAPGATPTLDQFCSLGHVLCSPQGNLDGAGDAALAAVGRSRHVVMTMPVFSGVYHAVAESDLVALLPLRLAQRIARRLNLTLYHPPMPVDVARICMFWHRRSTQSAANIWLREQIIAILEPLHADANHMTTLFNPHLAG